MDTAGAERKRRASADCRCAGFDTSAFPCDEHFAKRYELAAGRIGDAVLTEMGSEDAAEDAEPLRIYLYRTCITSRTSVFVSITRSCAAVFVSPETIWSITGRAALPIAVPAEKAETFSAFGFIEIVRPEDVAAMVLYLTRSFRKTAGAFVKAAKSSMRSKSFVPFHPEAAVRFVE